MLYSLLMWIQKTKHIGWLQVVRYVSLRSLLGMITSLLVSLILGPWFIKLFRTKQVGEQIRDDGPKEHEKKSGTPTMGGGFILISLLVSTLLWTDIKNRFVWICCAGTFAMGLIGFVDDYLKITVSKKGLSGKLKLFFQFLVSSVLVVLLFSSNLYDAKIQFQLAVPFLSFTKYHWIILPSVGYIIFGILLIIGTSNAVNLTDGLDGLAIGPVIICSGTFLIFAYLSGSVLDKFKPAEYLHIAYIPGVQELCIFCAAMVGAGIGFLWYNAYPAQIFMGDVGALALGGALGFLALISKNELVFIILGGIFVVEALSVILQVISFKLTRKRLFRMAPLHHHFELKGWSEPKIIVRFWIISILLALIALTTLKIR